MPSNREIAQGVSGGGMSMEEAMSMWEASHAQNAGSMIPVESHVEQLPAQQNRGIQHAPLRVPTIEVNDRKALSAVRRDLALVVESTSVQHEYERQMVEERARHIVAMPAVALPGVADGALEAIGYGISELAETITYTAVRTVRRVKEGVERGWKQ